ncbi:MAG: peptidylprolyl isomerase [Deltaproteobacteria bacterium]|nr:peptidylprolyl isomerase [Deltaproteobacteria bacterium]
MAIEEGSKVKMEYTLTLEDGTVADTNVGGAPLDFEQGKGMLIPGLEVELNGMDVGDEKEVTVAPDKAYGNVDPKAFEEIPKDKIPEDMHVLDSMLQATTPDGNTVGLRVHEIKDDTIVVDANHPFAGKTLKFNVKILDVK